MMVSHKMMKCLIPAANGSLYCAIGKQAVISIVVCCVIGLIVLSEHR